MDVAAEPGLRLVAVQHDAQAAAPDVPEAETKVFASALERELKKGDGK